MIDDSTIVIERTEALLVFLRNNNVMSVNSINYLDMIKFYKN